MIVTEVMEVPVANNGQPKVDGPRHEKFQMATDRGFIAQIDEYRYANKIPSRAQAVRTLVSKGLEAARDGRS